MCLPPTRRRAGVAAAGAPWRAETHANRQYVTATGTSAWNAEIARLNQDPATGHKFRKGDLVAITANGSLFFGGKRNSNETHKVEPEVDFPISLVASNYGLPGPAVLSLTSLMRANDNDAATSEDIFDVTRAAGGERWQGVRARINGLTMVTTNGWNSDQHVGQPPLFRDGWRESLLLTAPSALQPRRNPNERF